MSLVRVWVHAVWSTKNREPLLNDAVRPKVFEHIFHNGRKKGLGMNRVNGYRDHVHALFRLPNDIPISMAIQLLKGESSFWINRNALVNSRFEWQNEYLAKSVSEEKLHIACHYIDNQEMHHKLQTFDEEYTAMSIEEMAED